MKSFSLSVLVFIFITVLPENVSAQTDCRGTFKEYYLNSNNIRAAFFPRGNKFTNGSDGEFLVPYPSDKRLSTIFASSPWIGGFDDAGNLKLAVETYPPQNIYDYSVGPLSPIGVPIDDCEKFNQAWSVYYEDIKRHKVDYETDFKIDDTISSIFGWPARGNKHFKKYYGFFLPDDNFGLAPFRDYNGNNIYDPENGDYPTIRPQNPHEQIPDQILWMVFNDTDEYWPVTEDPLRFEIQLTAYAYHCQDNELLNNTIFNSYRILNRAVSSIDSVFFGMWTDYDLGCYGDDFVGSDSTRNTEFVYNADSIDGDAGTDCTSGSDTYGNPVPVQSMTYLNYPMHAFVVNDPGSSHVLASYRNLNGQWSDGSVIRPQGDGHDASSTEVTRFMFHGDPRDTSSWAANNVFDEGRDQKTVSSVFIGRMDPGQWRVVESAYTYHYSSTAGHLDQITHMYNNVDSLLASLGDLDKNCTRFPFCTDDDCVWPGDFDKNGIADHRDYLAWGAMNGQSGAERNGLVSWRSQYAPDWSVNIGGINTKHGDGDGNGVVDINDIKINTENFLLTNEDFENEALYPQGNEVIISADPIDVNGRISNLRVAAGQDLQNLLGIAFELEFDTSLFKLGNLILTWAENPTRLIYRSPFAPEEFLKIAYVQTDNTGIDVDSNSWFLRFGGTGLSIKSGLPVPSCTAIKLRNLIGIDADGNNLHLGSHTLVVCKEGVTATQDPEEEKINIYPNPATDQFWIDITGAYSIEIINSLGRIVKTTEVTGTSAVDVSELPGGMYFIRIPALGRTLKLMIE